MIADLVADEHVPHLAALRYKDTGLSPVDGPCCWCRRGTPRWISFTG
ncbi:hypothetical protein [Micromonospora sp. DT229]